MLRKLQRKTLIPAQIVGYTLGICTGICIIIIAIQFYADVKPVLSGQTDVFKNNTAIISKNISLFSNLSHKKVFFTGEDINELESQDFVAGISPFNNSAFEVSAFTSTGGDMPFLQTELFFESIPDRYLDVLPEAWKWDSTQNFIPIIIPEDYLNLYNFGFAESQGLPVFSKNAINQISFNVRIAGQGQSSFFKSRIVGFSGKINSILVPDNFLVWANKKFGHTQTSNPNRLLVEMKNPADQQILSFFKAHNYNINKEKLELGKIMFFFKTAFGFVFFIALVITILSVAFVYLSFRLIFEKNREQIRNLYDIGYSIRKIAVFYQWVISIMTTLAIAGSMAAGYFLRQYYLDRISSFVDAEAQQNYIFPVGIMILLCLIVIYNVILPGNIRKIVRKNS